MELPGDLECIHQPNRLRIMALLHERGDVAAGAARDTLSMSPGNLDAHVRRLESDGLLQQRKALLPHGFEARIRITAKGATRFKQYLAWLEAFLATQN